MSLAEVRFILQCFIDAVWSLHFCLWSRVNTTFDVSWRYIRADLGITFSASAALPIDAPYAVDTLSIMNLCLCFSFGVYIAWWRVHIYFVWLL